MKGTHCSVPRRRVLSIIGGDDAQVRTQLDASNQSSKAAKAHLARASSEAAEQKALASELQKQLQQSQQQQESLASELQKQLEQTQRQREALASELQKQREQGQKQQAATISELHQELEDSRQRQATLASELATTEADLRSSQTSCERLKQSIDHDHSGLQHEASLRKQLRHSVRLMRAMQRQPDVGDVVSS